MKNPILKSIMAILAGLVPVIVLSVITDQILDKAGIMKLPFNDNPTWFIILVVVYRNVYRAFGSYLAARLAPNKPMRHTMILDISGAILATLGTVTMWHIPPQWYPVSLIVLALPSAWLGGTTYQGLHTRKIRSSDSIFKYISRSR